MRERGGADIGLSLTTAMNLMRVMIPKYYLYGLVDKAADVPPQYTHSIGTQEGVSGRATHSDSQGGLEFLARRADGAIREANGSR